MLEVIHAIGDEEKRGGVSWCAILKEMATSHILSLLPLFMNTFFS